MILGRDNRIAIVPPQTLFRRRAIFESVNRGIHRPRRHPTHLSSSSSSFSSSLQSKYGIDEDLILVVLVFVAFSVFHRPRRLRPVVMLCRRRCLLLIPENSSGPYIKSSMTIVLSSLPLDLMIYPASFSSSSSSSSSHSILQSFFFISSSKDPLSSSSSSSYSFSSLWLLL